MGFCQPSIPGCEINTLRLNFTACCPLHTVLQAAESPHVHTHTQCFCLHIGRKICKAGLAISYIFDCVIYNPYIYIYTVWDASINANKDHPHSVMNENRNTHTVTMLKYHRNNNPTTAVNDVAVCYRCFPIKFSSGALGGEDSYYVPATCDSLSQHWYIDRNIIYTPVIPR